MRRTRIVKEKELLVPVCVVFTHTGAERDESNFKPWLFSPSKLRLGGYYDGVLLSRALCILVLFADCSLNGLLCPTGAFLHQQDFPHFIDFSGIVFAVAFNSGDLGLLLVS